VAALLVPGGSVIDVKAIFDVGSIQRAGLALWRL
jgi:hypothetical protein